MTGIGEKILYAVVAVILAALIFLWLAMSGVLSHPAGASTDGVTACDAYESLTSSLVPEYVGGIVDGSVPSSPGVDAIRDVLFECRNEGIG